MGLFSNDEAYWEQEYADKKIRQLEKELEKKELENLMLMNIIVSEVINKCD
jgi:hypothetical protein